MRIIFSVSLLFLFNLSGYGHKANEAFFEVIEKDSTVEVKAEFPWSLRNALITFNPSLENATRNKDFKNTFTNYLIKNLILTDVEKDTLKFIQFRTFEKNGHSHQNNYLIIFEGNGLKRIKNTILFNLYNNQVNYHNMLINSENSNFQTKKNQPYFELPNTTTFNYWWLLILGLPLIYFTVKKR